ATSLPAGAGDSTRKVAPEGSIQSRNDGGIMGYVGPCPPQGDKPHRYLITLYALKIDKVPLDATASGGLVGFYLNGNALGKATMTAYYGSPSSFQLTSPVLKDFTAINTDQIANGFGCSGGNMSPELDWKGAPDGTKSFALTVYDSEAPTGSGFWHWII